MSSLMRQQSTLNPKTVSYLQSLLFATPVDNEDEADIVETSTKLGDESEDIIPFLQRVKIASVPTFDLFVFANDDKFVVVNAEDAKVGAQPVISKNLDEQIVAVACWPVPPSRLTDPRPYEWTAVVVGCESGLLHFYTDRGYFLMKQQFTRSSVVEIRVEVDQLSVLFEDCYVVVNGLTLLAALKTCRHRIARGESVVESEISVEIISQKFSLDGCSTPTCVASTGIVKQSLWDQMATASSCGGYYAKLSSSSSTNAQTPYDTYLTTGRDIFANFNWYTDAVRTSDFIADAFSSVTNKFKSTLGSFWGGDASTSKKHKSDSNLEQKRAVRVPQRSALSDQSRTGEHIQISPNSRLAVICDDHGRVVLVDTRKRVAMRVWKGYRDAQCGWFEIGENTKKKGGGHKALCLVIFAPRRGILEVWSMQNGQRVAAFNVDKDGLLIYCPMVNLNFQSDSPPLPVRFLDSTGNFFAPSVSFGVAVDKRSASTYWTAETKEKFFTWWSNIDFSNKRQDSAVTRELKVATSSISNAIDLRFLVETVIKTEMVTYKVAANLLEDVLERLTSFVGDVQNSAELRTFFMHCSALKQMVNLYAVVSTLADGEDFTPDCSKEDLADLFYVDEEYLTSICNDLDDNLMLRAKEVLTTATKSGLTLARFLTLFDFSVSHSLEVIDESTTLPMHLSNKVNDEDVRLLGDFLFSPFLVKYPTKKFTRDVQPLSGFAVNDLVSTLCRFWLNEHRPYSVHPQKLYELLTGIFALYGEYSQFGAALGTVQQLLMNSDRAAECLSLCLVLRAVAKRRQEEERKRADEDEWEKFEGDVEQWDLLMKVLHGVLLLNTFLCKFSSATTLTLTDVLSTGFGFVDEQVAKNSVDANISPKEFVEMLSTDREGKSDERKASLNKLKAVFPASLTKLSLPAYCCWEHCRRWFANVANVSLLSRGVEYLTLVDNEFVRRGLALLIWQKFLSAYVEDLCLFLEDCADDACERFYAKTQIVQSDILPFLRAVNAVGRALVENDELLLNCRRQFDVEDFVREFFTCFAKHANHRESLVTVAADQAAPDKRRARVHYVLSVLLLMIVEHQGSLTETSPFVLFTESDEELLFERLNVDEGDEEKKGQEEKIDKRLQNRRVALIKSWNSATLSQKSGEMDLRFGNELALEWNLNVDELRRHEILALFSANRASDASKLLHLVEDRQMMADELLDLVCKNLCVRMQRTKAKPTTSGTLEAHLAKFKKYATSSNKAVSLTLKTCSKIMLFVSGVTPRQAENVNVVKDLCVLVENLSRSSDSF